MKTKIRLLSYVIAVVIIFMLIDFVYKYFSGIVNNQLVYTLEESMLGELFQFIKLLFIGINLIGVVLCVVLIIKNIKKFNRYVLWLVLFNFFYAVICFLWVFNSTNIPEIQAEQLMTVMDDIISGEPQNLNPLIRVGLGTQVRLIYQFNLYNAIIMVIACLLLIFLKSKLDKKISILL